MLEREWMVQFLIDWKAGTKSLMDLSLERRHQVRRALTHRNLPYTYSKDTPPQSEAQKG